MDKRLVPLANLLQGYGLRLEHGGKHYLVKDARDKLLTSVATSPSDPYFARQTVRYLVRCGALPESCRSARLV